MKHWKSLGFLLVPLVLGISGCAWLRPDLAARVATGTTAHDLCSETFVSGLDPGHTFDESLKPRPGFDLIAPLMRYEIDRGQGWVRASIAGGFSSLAVYKGHDGCMLVKQPDATVQKTQVTTVMAARSRELLAEPPVIAPTSPALGDAVDEAFAENVPGSKRNTKAVIVLHRGRVVAERYAPGYGPETPVLGFSLSKSVINALVGILVRDGKLQLKSPLPLTNHAALTPTVENALRMTTGLDLDETGSGFDPSNHLLYVRTDDMAAFAEKAKTLEVPGQRWAYSSAGIHLLARLVRDTVGGGEAVQRFAQNRLFGPLGMQHVTMETDETGTPIGAHYILATSRDWARFGMLYLNDGVAMNGQRVLPENWVRWSTEPTLNTDYGAGWWLNRRSAGAQGTVHDMPLMPDVPSDAFYALGNLGQYVVVVPSKELVVVRLGRAHTPDFDIAGMNSLLAKVIAALAQ